ncbi:MAG: proprotein convertase P-domain-containing protein [Planctomycetota bacterium]|nr:proprotein convertase P-domain-containing protein [Planctomycetota bacterium]
MVSTLAVTVPSGATALKSLKLNGTAHTYLGDVQFVLQNPAGGLYNVYCGQTSAGNIDLNGDYVLVDPIALAPSWASGGNPVVNGTYSQDYGAFTNGSAGINNTPLEQIPISSGTWTLYVYDWAAADVGAVTNWELCFGLPTPPPPPPPTVTCVPNGSGSGLIPAAGTGGNGTWPGTLPPTPFVSSHNVTVPAGATKIGKVELVGMTHTWTGDLQMVLTDPSGTQHNLFTRPGSVNGSVGLNCDLAGDYAIYQSGQSNWNCSGATHTPGNYNQLFGTWTSGTLNIFNTALGSIPVATGTWTLTIYDWANGDSGGLTDWRLCFEVPSGPLSYCTAGTTTNGCAATITASANPSVSLANACNISVTNVEGQKSGLIFYSINGQQAQPWNATSFLCVKAPTQRSSTQTSGGAVNSCTGALSLDWNAFQTANPSSLGNPWSAGNKAQLQAWFRDPPAGKATNLSNAIEMTYLP